MIGKRRRGREIALQILFSKDLQREGDVGDFDGTIENAEGPHEAVDYGRNLAKEVLEQQEHLDRLIGSAADNWDLTRLTTVDRNILRLATYELVERNDIPTKVAINEAIELGKTFSTAQSGAFINGILDRIRQDLDLPMDEVVESED